MAKSFAEKSPSFLPFLEQVSWGSEYRTAHNHDAWNINPSLPPPLKLRLWHKMSFIRSNYFIAFSQE